MYNQTKSLPFFFNLTFCRALGKFTWGCGFKFPVGNLLSVLKTWTAETGELQLETCVWHSVPENEEIVWQSVCLMYDMHNRTKWLPNDYTIGLTKRGFSS